MDWGPPTYQVILGADALGPLGARVTAGSDEWRVRLGKKRYRSVKLVTKGEYVGAAVVRSPDAVTPKNVRDKFREVFYVEGDPIPATGRVTHHIELKSDRPVYVKPRRYPQAQAAVIEKEIKLMLERGVIRKSVSPFCSPLWVVPKPPAGDGTPRYRVVVDFRELNKRTRTERYPLPRLEEMLDRMHGAKVFSIVDLKAGYHQIRMHPGHVEKTAFQFERGKYEYLRMPFGLKTAPTTFQRLMDEFLEGLDPNAIQVYMDDIIVFSKSEAEHCAHLGQLLKWLREFGLKASEEKSSFFQAELKFMGHTVSASGVSANREKVEAVRSLPVPKEVKSFQGMVGCYRKFIPNSADRLAPWTRLLRKGVKFVVTADMIEEFNRIKEALTNAPVLRYPDFTRPFVLTTDASGGSGGRRPFAGRRRQRQADRVRQ
ncbi:hypothetical protein AAG570_006215 [Ranatra chinensis]|uniref:RNA-directed DNA polymerase n=1 Tax=Ranatra chinensis TaxID=642074 RepID=A0ABD0ZGK8_9HEMI